MRQRRDEANRSILVQVNSEKSYGELSNYCSQFGNIKKSFHYENKDKNNFILLEFECLDECQEALKNSVFNPNNTGIPVSSPFLWFRAPTRKNENPANSREIPNLISDNIKLIGDENLIELLSSAQSIEDQIKILYNSTKLNELGYRMRFLMSRQLANAMNGIFPLVQVHPFGSSVNGYGKIGCDLDIVMMLNLNKPKREDSRLVYHTKVNTLGDRAQVQRNMEVMGDIMHLFLPGVSNVRRILQARVPILKFNHECLDLDVDLSMNSFTGFYMAELLYLFGQVDERVCPLTFCVRKWASTTGITNQTPGRWISNFQISCLVLFFLQQLERPILPSIKTLIKAARPEDRRTADDNIDCTFLRDLNVLNFQRTNNDNLTTLLKKFFEFYSQFDFGSKAVSLHEGKPTSKPDHAAIWIVNPLEQMLNVSKNVSYEEMEKFKNETRNAAWILESCDEKPDKQFWGLLSIFKANKSSVVKPEMFFKSRLVHVSDLFKDGNVEQPENITYKNYTTKAQVEMARRVTKKEIQKMHAKLRRR